MKSLTLLTGLAFIVSTTPVSRALTIELDFSYDQADIDFFGTYSEARSALEQAASDISALIDSSLGAISLGQSELISGSAGGTTVSYDWSLSFANPTGAGGSVSLPSFSVAADTVKVYVGSRSLSGSTLAQGGTSGAGFSLSASNIIEANWIAAHAAAQSASNTVMLRGGQAPRIGTISGSWTVGSTTANYSAGYAPIVGSLWFDNDTNDDGEVDDESLLENFWHFNHTTDVVAGDFDFYTVAVHEILHALGFGTGESWNDLVSGDDWLGTQAAAENGGSSVGLIVGGAHIAEGTMSSIFPNGASQEAIMDPTLTAGTRKFITDLDAAFLNDIGYSTVPEPGAYGAIFGVFVLGFAGSRRRRT